MKSLRSARFGPFEFTSDCVLRRDGKEVPLGSRAGRLLWALLIRPGEIVAHRDLLSAGWPDSDVEESSLRAHVRVLRKALHSSGTPYVVNEHARGYRFVAPVEFTAAAQSEVGRFKVPQVVGRLIGRDRELSYLTEALASKRVVSIVGPGGVGKSTLSFSLAAKAQSRFHDGIAFVDLAALQPGSEVLTMISDAVGLEARPDSVSQLAAFLRNRRYLLILDNCEHLIGPIAKLTNVIVRETPDVSVLITSREPTKADPEFVLRLEGLPFPSTSADGDWAQLHAYPAVALFLERAQQSDATLKVSEANASAIVRICRKLDGVPLALEIAAGWVGFSGLSAIADGIPDRLLTMSDDSHSSRQRSLEAVLAWSYKLLSADERRVFDALAIFQATFSLSTVERLLSLAGLPPGAISHLDALFDKSLIANDPQQVDHFRMAESAKSFARAKLNESSSYSRVATAHLLWSYEQLDGVEAALALLPRSEWMRRYGALVSEVTAALSWALQDDGDWALGVATMVRFSPLALQILHHDKIGALLRLAIQRAVERGDVSEREIVELSMRLGMITNDQAGDYHQHLATLKLGGAAEEFESVASRLMSGFASAFTRGDYPDALRYATRFDELATSKGDGAWLTLAARVFAQCHHFLGSHDLAEQYAEAVIEAPFEFLPTSHISHRVSARIVLARIAFIKGRDDVAERYAAEALNFAELGNATAVCQSLALGRIPVLIWQGRGTVARKFMQVLRDTADQANLPYWGLWANAFRVALDSQDDERDARIAAFLEVGDIPHKLADLLPTLDPRMLTPTALQRTRSGVVGWNAPEVLRAESLTYGLRPVDAQALALSALKLAETQGARAWTKTAGSTLQKLRMGSSPSTFV